ncbi:MAG TPA: hypothetical protein VNA16_00060, partial [Abditibacteriaceae bacterium]|nr:hypothetical protein [Abditibacteriaceae bacterium]
ARLGPPVREPTAGAPASTVADGFIARSETMVVTPRQAAGYSLLRGRLKPVVSAVGKAPLAAQVAQVVVRPGQQVHFGDAVLNLATGLRSRSARRAELSQKIAEDNQVAAARRQDALQAKIGLAQERLVKAKERVAAAQQRVAAAREIVANLRRGEGAAAPADAPLDSSVNRTAPERTAPERTAPERTNSATDAKEQSRLTAARRDALRDAQQAQVVAERAEAAVLVARRAAEIANKTLEAEKARAREAREAVTKVQSLFDAGKAKASDVDTARAAVEDAEAKLVEAAKKSAGAVKEVNRTEAAAAEAHSQTQKATAQVARSLQQLQLFAQSTPAADDGPERAGADKPLSVAEAARMARAALAESESAIATADSIRREIDGYQSQVNLIRERLAVTSSNLDQAQDRLMETTIQQGLARVRAPASGTILWVADVADEVAPGEPIVAVGQPGVWEVRLADASGTWKALKIGMQLPAVVQQATMENAGMKNLAQPAAFARPGLLMGTPATARLDAIVPPVQPGAPALLKVIIANPGGESSGGESSGRRFRAGMTALCSIARPGNQVAISIPRAALLRDADGSAQLAVLTPLEPDARESDAATAVTGLHRIEWREVRLGPGDEVQQEITAGLFAGERIALRPRDLRALTLAHGAAATVEVGDMS